MKYSKYNIYIEPNENMRDLLLVNTLSGSIFKIDTKVKQCIEKNDLNFLSEKDKEMYIKAGIIVEDYIDETNYVKYANHIEKYKSTVLSLTVLLTMDCNFKCVYCYQGADNKEKVALSEATKDKIFKFIQKRFDDNQNLKALCITLFGGEPLLYLEKDASWLDMIQNYCTNNGKNFSTNIITNGSLISDNNIVSLKKYNCQTIQITLDGLKEIHDKRRIYKNNEGTFDKVVEGIKSVLKSQMNLTIRINIDKTNINQTYELLEYLKREELTNAFIDFGIVRDFDNNDNFSKKVCFDDSELGDVLYPLWHELLKLGFRFNPKPFKRAVYCGAHKDSFFTIDPKGIVYTCWEFVGNKEQEIGVLDENGNIIGNEYNYVNWMASDFSQIPLCLDCAYLPICCGGCTSVGYNKQHDLVAPGCFKTKSIYKEQIRFCYENAKSKV